MIVGNLTAWIQTSDDKHLNEYATKQIDDKTIECWIPSTEGINFQIGYGCLELPKHTLDLRCSPTLDGVTISTMITRTRYLRDQLYDLIEDEVVSSSTRRLLVFGKRILTDREDIAPSKGQSSEDLNSIQVFVEWGRAGKAKARTEFPEPEENGPIHEKAAKKGHAGSAGLGKDTLRMDDKVTTSTFKVSDKMDSVLFIFRYGPEDWLQARGIMPSEISTSRKRDRQGSNDVIDIDNLETDNEDDEVTIVKHLVPAPVTLKSKRQKLQEEDDEAKPKSEP